MNNMPREIRHALRADPILQAMLGYDNDGEVKVYTPLAKPNVEAPYVTFSIIPNQGPVAVYGDSEVLEPFPVAISAWGRDGIEAWSIADAVDDAAKRADYSFEPYDLMYVLRTSTPREFQDRDTGLFYLVTSYSYALGR